MVWVFFLKKAFPFKFSYKAHEHILNKSSLLWFLVDHQSKAVAGVANFDSTFITFIICSSN